VKNNGALRHFLNPNASFPAGSQKYKKKGLVSVFASLCLSGAHPVKPVCIANPHYRTQYPKIAGRLTYDSGWYMIERLSQHEFRAFSAQR
jgi:hypothetical protein